MTEESARKGPGARLVGWLARAALLAVGVVGVFVVVEGAASVFLVVYDVVFNAESLSAPPGRMARHDPDLGWVTAPNVSVDDAFGAGRHVRTNSLGIRASHEFGEAVPAGRVRVVCSGDSATWGFGVGNEESWCHLLERNEPVLQAANISEAGYGIDQMYLKYGVVEQLLDHDIHLFSFVADDFARMARPVFGGYAKPTLALVDGRIEVRDTPVPQLRVSPWLTLNWHLIAPLRSLAFGNRLLAKLADDAEADDPWEERVRAVSLALFDDLSARSAASNRLLVFVNLPEAARESLDEERWSAWLAQELDGRDAPYIDVTAAFRRLSYAERNDLFDPEWFHFSAAGHRFIADVVMEQLQDNPRYVERLEAPASGEPATR